MYTPRFSMFVRVMVVVFGLAVIASGVNTARVEWTTNDAILRSSGGPTPRPDIDMTRLSPAAKADEIKNRLADLQRQLDETRRRSRDTAEARAARSQALAYLRITSALLFAFLMLMIFQQRRLAAGKPASGRGGP